MIYRRLLWAVLFLWTARVEAGPPSIESLSTPAVQLGQPTQVEIIGAGMLQVREVVFYASGIRTLKIEAVDEYKLLATIQVDEGCAIKSLPFRLRGDDGFSELRTLRVNRFPVVGEAERKSVDAVIELPTKNLTVSGVLQSGDYDRYSIQLEKGQRFTAEAEAMRLGGDLLDTVLTVLDPQGRLLFVNDDGSVLHQDPTLSFTAPTSGKYLVEIRESNYGGSNNSRYLLHLGTFPPARIAFPAGGQIGSGDQAVTFVSENKQDKPLEQVVSLPKDAADFQLFAVDDLGISASPIPFRLNECRNIIESEPNQSVVEAIKQFPNLAGKNAVSAEKFMPVAFNGIIRSEYDIDFFAIEVNQGQPLRIDVFANRIGSPIDAYLELFDSNGRLLAHNDDCDSHDSRIEFVAPATGQYVLALRDKLNRGFHTGVYRIEVQANDPALKAFLPRPERISQRQQTVTVPRGNRSLARVAVLRENIEGEVQLRFTDLPEGVRANPVYVAADEFWAIAILEADSQAPISGKLAGISASCQTVDQLVHGNFQQTVDLVAESADRLYHSAVVDQLAVAVTTELPFTVDIEQPKTELPINGTIELIVRVKRKPEFQAAIQIEFPYLPDGCVGEPELVIAPEQSEAIYKVTATGDSIEGNFKLAAVASVRLSEGRNRIDDRSDPRPRERGRKQMDLNAFQDREAASNLIDLQIVRNPISGQFSGLAAERGKSSAVKCSLMLADKGEVPQKLDAQLEGLPKGVTAKPIQLSSEQTTVNFELVITPEAPTGSFEGIQCRLSGVHQGSAVSYVVPSENQLLIAEPGKLIRSDDGNVLSPLEALRKQNGK